MRIVHVYGHSYGGAFVLNQLRVLQERGHDVLAIVPGVGPFVGAAEDLGIEIRIVPFGGAAISKLGRVAGATLQLSSLLRSLRPAIVHTHLLKANVVGRIAAYLAGVPVVSQLGGPLPLEVFLFRWLDLSSAWIDSTIIASSEAIARIYSRYPHTRGKVEVNYYGFDPGPFLLEGDPQAFRSEANIPSDALVVGMVAHMYPSHLRRFRSIGLKGHEVLVDATARMIAANPRIRVIIVGDDISGGDYRVRLEHRARALGIDRVVQFCGHRKDIPRVLSAMDVVVVPSLSENLGGAVEPLLVRRPVVASAVGGLPEVVIDGETGRLVPPGEAKALADAVLELLSLPAQRRAAMGALGRDVVLAKFELQRSIDRLEAIYDRVLSARRRAGRGSDR